MIVLMLMLLLVPCWGHFHRTLGLQVKARHNASVPLFAGVRYVAADDIVLSPQQGRANAVISSIVLGDRKETGNPAEFQLYGQGLENICKAKYHARPHWGESAPWETACNHAN